MLVLPASTHSGSMYPIVPAMPVVCDPRPSLMSLASPKSPNLAVKEVFNMMLLGFMSLCTTRYSVSWCRYMSAEPTPSTISYFEIK